MQIHNETPFQFGLATGRLDPRQQVLAFVVKGTFDLEPGAPARPAAEQLLPTGDEPYDPDADPPGSLRYEHDFALFKPRADVLVVGTAHAPGGRPAAAFEVAMRVGSLAKRLRVVGERSWRAGFLGGKVTEPEPFVTLPLRYEFAFGAPGFPPNPVGRGHLRRARDARGGAIPLPRIETPDRAAVDPTAAYEPAGFGPLGRGWATRRARLGTFDDDWLAARWPWLPADADPAHANAAPDDQQVAGYLRGDEAITLEHLDPDEPLLEAALPGVRARCFVRRQPEEAGREPQFEEVSLALDTLWIDADRRRLVLVWRGHLPVADERALEVAHVLVAREELAAPPAPPREFEQRLAARLAAEQAELEAELPPPAPPTERQPPPWDPALIAAHEQAQPPAPPPGLVPQPPSPARQAALERLMAELGVVAPPAAVVPPPAREQVLRAHAEGEELAEADLAEADLAAIDAPGVRLPGARLVRADLRGARLAGAVLDGAQLGGAVLDGADLRGASLRGADLSGARLAQADLTEAMLEEALLDGAELGGARLTGAQAAGASLQEVRAQQALFTGAVLVGADLSGARLDGADLRGAALAEASLEGARAVGAALDGATARELRAGEGCDLSRASLRELNAPDSAWQGARLDDADLSGARLDGADFSGATLARARLYRCWLRGARFGRADLSEAFLVEADLFEADFEKADLGRARLDGASLYGAESWEARVEGASLAGANLRATKLERR